MVRYALPKKKQGKSSILIVSPNCPLSFVCRIISSNAFRRIYIKHWTKYIEAVCFSWAFETF